MPSHPGSSPANAAYFLKNDPARPRVVHSEAQLPICLEPFAADRSPRNARCLHATLYPAFLSSPPDGVSNNNTKPQNALTSAISCHGKPAPLLLLDLVPPNPFSILDMANSHQTSSRVRRKNPEYTTGQDGPVCNAHSDQQPLKEVAQRFEVSYGTICNWVSEFRACRDQGDRPPFFKSPLEDDLQVSKTTRNQRNRKSRSPMFESCR